MFKTARALAAVLLAMGFSGCGGSRTSPVEGVVLLDGKPVAGASVQFVPQGAGRDATAETDQNGQFVLSTFEPRDGAIPGAYKVVISPPVGVADKKVYASSEEAMAAADKAKPAKATGSRFPQQYTRPDQTPLTQDVPVQGEVKFELKSS